MAKIKFDLENERSYENGISECVLFVKTGDTYGKGVAWNGITTLSESPEGAEETALYADDIKWLSLRSIEEFKGSITAYMYPDEFGECDGSEELCDGLVIDQQARKSFGLVYTTKKYVGGVERKIIHVVYNASVSPSGKDHNTINDSPEAQEMSWDFSTISVSMANGKKVSHLKIDCGAFTETAAKARLQTVLDTLYGTDASGEETTGTDPTFMTPDQIFNTLKAPAND